MVVTSICYLFDRFSFSTMFFAHSKYQFFVFCDMYGPCISGGYFEFINLLFSVCVILENVHRWYISSYCAKLSLDVLEGDCGEGRKK